LLVEHVDVLRKSVRHVYYIHYNPVKHGLVLRTVDGPLSSTHRYIKQHIIDEHWTWCDDFERIDFGEN
jgi:hypothetical protein